MKVGVLGGRVWKGEGVKEEEKKRSGRRWWDCEGERWYDLIAHIHSLIGLQQRDLITIFREFFFVFFLSFFFLSFFLFSFFFHRHFPTTKALIFLAPQICSQLYSIWPQHFLPLLVFILLRVAKYLHLTADTTTVSVIASSGFLNIPRYSTSKTSTYRITSTFRSMK